MLTDRHDEAEVAFHNFANTPKKCQWMAITDVIKCLLNVLVGVMTYQN
jgi:hypothetical protein